MRNAWRSFSSFLLPLIDMILPERERAARIRKRALKDFFLCPTTHSLQGQQITTLLDYKDNYVSDLVRALKYEHSNHAADICAEALADYLHEEIASMRLFSPHRILLVPVPLHTSRLRERGFNQTEKVLRRLPEEFKNGTCSTLLPTVLRRTRATLQQTRLTKSERLKNVTGAFVAGDADIRGAHVMLIDDVTTTGATLSCAAKSLRAAGAQVSLIALARA